MNYRSLAKWSVLKLAPVIKKIEARYDIHNNDSIKTK